MQCRVVVVDEEVAFQTFVSGAYQSDSRDTADSFLGDPKDVVLLSISQCEGGLLE